jgi:hypothetical protein
MIFFGFTAPEKLGRFPLAGATPAELSSLTQTIAIFGEPCNLVGVEQNRLSRDPF